MSLRDLTLSDWARMSDEVAQRECEALARSLPHGLRFDALVMHEYGGRRHRVAGFSRGDVGDLVQFVLVPGGEVSLGFDGRDFRPSAGQIASFAESANAYDLGSSIHSFVDSQTSARGRRASPDAHRGAKRGRSSRGRMSSCSAQAIRSTVWSAATADRTSGAGRRRPCHTSRSGWPRPECGCRPATSGSTRAAAEQRHCFAGAMTARWISTPPTPVRRIAISRRCGRCRWAGLSTSARRPNGPGTRGRICSG